MVQQHHFINVNAKLMSLATNRPKAIKILLPTGDLHGVKIIEIGNWIGKILVIPKVALPEILDRRRFEMQTAALYFLYRSVPKMNPVVYVGETENFRRRIKEHYSRRNWEKVFVILAKDNNLNKAHIKYLEYAAFKLVNKGKQALLVNHTVPIEPNLSEVDRSEMLHFLFNARLALSGAGYNFLDPAV